MNPTPNDFVNVVLTNLVVGWRQNPASFVARSVFPVVPVELQGGVYYEFSRADMNRNLMKVRAPGAESAGGGFRMTKNPYFCNVRALHKDLDQQTLKNFPQFDLEKAASAWLNQQALIAQEVDWAERFFAAGVWGTTVTGVAATPGANQFLQWNNGSSSPIEDLRTGIRTVHLASGGYKPNTIVFGKQTWDTLVDHPDVVDRVKGSAGPGNPAVVTKAAFAAILEVERVLVMEAVENTAPENSEGVNAREANAFIGGANALVCYANPVPAINQPSAGYTFDWTGYNGGNAVAVSSWWEQKIKSQRVEIEDVWDQRLTSAVLGYYFSAAVA